MVRLRCYEGMYGLTSMIEGVYNRSSQYTEYNHGYLSTLFRGYGIFTREVKYVLSVSDVSGFFSELMQIGE